MWIISKHKANRCSRYSDWLRAEQPGDRIPVVARFSSPVQTGPEPTHPSVQWVPCLSPGVKSSRGVTLTPHSLLVSWSRKSIAIPLLPLWTVRPVQSLSACKRVHFTLIFTLQTKLPAKQNMHNYFLWMIADDAFVLGWLNWLEGTLNS